MVQAAQQARLGCAASEADCVEDTDACFLMEDLLQPVQDASTGGKAQVMRGEAWALCSPGS